MKLLTVTKNIQKKILLLCSALAVLCLFLTPSLGSIVFTAMILVIIAVLAFFDVIKPDDVGELRTIKILVALMIESVGLCAFKRTWLASSKVEAAADGLGVNTHFFVSFIGITGCVLGFYFMYVLAGWIVRILKKRLFVKEEKQLISNLKRNWFFVISCGAIFSLSASLLTCEYPEGVIIAFLSSAVISTQISSVLIEIKKCSCKLRILSFLSAVGVCVNATRFFYANDNILFGLQTMEEKLLFTVNIFEVITLSLAILAVYSVYFYVITFWKYIIKVFKDNKIFGEIKKCEWIVYGIMFAFSIAFMVFSFLKSDVFYESPALVDIVYTSDSPSLMMKNAYLRLMHRENDLRQPLFAVFSAPFLGTPYLFAVVFGGLASVKAILMNGVQILILFVANFMIAKAMNLDHCKRICFMTLTFCTYTQLLFTLMIEQYIIAYFWLSLSVLLIVENKRLDCIALYGAGGTLLTSMILLPFVSENSPIKKFKPWLLDMIKCGLGFLVTLLVFCRFDILMSLKSNVLYLNSFSGEKIAFLNKLFQYTEFVRSCFVAPNTYLDKTITGDVLWRLDPAAGVNSIGLLIFFLCIASVVLNRDKMISLLSVGWVAFSVLILLVFGWGTAENGLILYSLYFGWAFLVLMFQLVEKIEVKLGVKFLIPFVTFCASVTMFLINIPSIADMLNFAITYYPI